MDDEVLNETVTEMATRAGLDIAALGGDMLGNLDALKGLSTAKRATEPTEWETHNLDILDGFLARYKAE